jgi:hypothetical protein
VPVVAPSRHYVAQVSVGYQQVDQGVGRNLPRCSEVLSEGQLNRAVDQAVMPGEYHAWDTGGFMVWGLGFDARDTAVSRVEVLGFDERDTAGSRFKTRVWGLGSVGLVPWRMVPRVDDSGFRTVVRAFAV